MPKVSIVIPAYNAMQYLPETLTNALQQTYDDYEVIIVNDGSTDGTGEWVSHFNHPKVSLITQENQGLSGARNTGIQHARGEYIALLDADDLWHPSKLAKQVQLLDASPNAGLIYTWTALIDEHGQSTGRFFSAQDEGQVWERLLEFNMVGCGSVPLIRRACFDEVGNFDRNLRSFVEDWDLWLRMAKRYDFRVIKEPLVYYRQRPGSASRNWEAMERSYRIVVEKNFADNTTATMLSLKQKCLGAVYLNLAWMALQGYAADASVSANYRNQALSHNPKVLLKWEFWRLNCAVFFAQVFGKEGYKNIRAILGTVRNRLVLLKS